MTAECGMREEREIREEENWRLFYSFLLTSHFLLMREAPHARRLTPDDQEATAKPSEGKR